MSHWGSPLPVLQGLFSSKICWLHCWSSCLEIGERKGGPLQPPSLQSITVILACPSHPSSIWVSTAKASLGHNIPFQPQNPTPGPEQSKAPVNPKGNTCHQQILRVPWGPDLHAIHQELPPSWLGCLASLSVVLPALAPQTRGNSLLFLPWPALFPMVCTSQQRGCVTKGILSQLHQEQRKYNI